MSWVDWAVNVSSRHPNTVFAAVYGISGDLYGATGNTELQGNNAKQEVAYLFSLPPDKATDEVYANGVLFGGKKFMFSKSIEVKDSMPNYLHFFNLKVPAGTNMSDDDKHILCVLKCNTCGIIALSKGGSHNQGIVKAVCEVGELLCNAGQ